jgi:hypothetical protein
MKRRVVLGVGVASVVVAGAVSTRSAVDRAASSVSTSPAGHRGASVLAEDFGSPLTSWRRPWTDLPGSSSADAPSLLVVSLPMRRRVTPEERSALVDWLERGNAVVILGDGNIDSLPAWMARQPFEWTMERLPRPSLAHPADWWTPVVLPPADPRSPAATLPRVEGHFASSPADTLVFGTNDGPAVRQRGFGSGTLWFVDGPLLSNRWLARSEAHTAWWAARVGGASQVYFDDYHQGLVAPSAIVETSPWPTRALYAHSALVWLVGAWMLGRPFGRTPSPVSAPRSAIGDELRAIARVHAHHGHAEGALRQLRACAGELVDDPPDPGAPAEVRLLHVARQVAELQACGRLD